MYLFFFIVVFIPPLFSLFCVPKLWQKQYHGTYCEYADSTVMKWYLWNIFLYKKSSFDIKGGTKPQTILWPQETKPDNTMATRNQTTDNTMATRNQTTDNTMATRNQTTDNTMATRKSIKKTM